VILISAVVSARATRFALKKYVGDEEMEHAKALPPRILSDIFIFVALDVRVVDLS